MLIAGNWKMFKGPAEAGEFCRALRDADLGTVDVVVCPPYVSLGDAVQALAGTEIGVAAQNVHWADDGAFTGEISAPMLRELGVYGTIVGHSERRQFFGETDETVVKRIAAAIGHGLHVIACVGETEAEREAGETEAVLRRQVGAIADGIAETDDLVIAYEPVWAIGTGKTATPEHGAGGPRVREDHSRRARALRRLGEARERGRARRAARRRRRTRRRRLAGRAIVCDDLPGRFPLVALVIADGWGCAPPGPGNAVELARTPVFDELLARYPHTELEASGAAVGLPDGQMGNSEVGHLTIGSGRHLYQDLERVNNAIELGELAHASRDRGGLRPRPARPPRRARLPRRRAFASRSPPGAARARTRRHLDPRLHRRPRRLSARGARRSRRAPAGADRHCRRAATTQWTGTTGSSAPRRRSTR